MENKLISRWRTLIVDVNKWIWKFPFLDRKEDAEVSKEVSRQEVEWWMPKLLGWSRGVAPHWLT